MTQFPHAEISSDALAIWKAGVAAVDARKAVEASIDLTAERLTIGDLSFSRCDVDRVIVVGAGKASGWMAAGFEDAVGNAFVDDHVAGHISVPDDQVTRLRKIDVVGSRPPGENLPGDRVLVGTDRILQLVRSATDRDLVVVMIAGGGSALLERPVDPVTLADLRAVTKMLSDRGASIHQLNSVRRAISQVKAGGLTRGCHAKHIVALIVSDVIGDSLDVIASGPTVLQSSSSLRPLEVVRSFDPAWKDTPTRVLEVLQRANQPDAVASCRVANQVLCNNQTAVAAAVEKAAELGYPCVRVETTGRHDDAEVIGQELATEMLELSSQDGRCCVISGGEPTVRLADHPGRGGRNQHLVLSALLQLLNDPQVKTQTVESAFCLLSGGTDGEDGNVPVAGAWLDSAMDFQSIATQAKQAFDSCDSYSIWNRLGRLIQVPPTRTNVCDLRVLLTARSLKSN